MSQIVRPENDSLLAMLLASGASINDAAEKAGVCRKTVERRLADPDFRGLIADFHGQLIAAALGEMAGHLTKAARVVAELLDAPEPHTRLRAARAMFLFTLRLRDSVELADQINQVKAELDRKLGDLP